MSDQSIGIGSFGAGRCEIRGLTPEEIDLVQGSMRGGHNWIRRGNDGRLEHVPSYEPLPSPVEDKEMYPFWRKPTEDEPVQLELISSGEMVSGYDPSITIQSLCGYNYSEENYAIQAELLTSYGFECLRSRRGNDGKFTEIWYLPGTWAAKGDLQFFIGCAPNGKGRTKVAIEFLRTHASFGTLDASIQRLAMQVPD